MTALLYLQILKTDDGLQITLGSATGAYSSFKSDVTPSFVLLDIDGSKVCGKAQAEGFLEAAAIGSSAEL